ncbi:DMT family transporter [Azohydromonas caseinilytica]|uniref:DMT family transporter n=1 Tax=Azohydromonas caseinilytica TaxID=2728836 RepID=A0A848F477_9BURK|nr:DMT family transporter [Azohydromonas caseinilytica]NML14192.1 DMT family transporter [Azohydromonas caseinilytica]
MKGRDRLELIVLAALWGGSFLFMRLAAPAFGASGLAAVRVAVATAVLLPLLGLTQPGALAACRGRWGALTVVGLLNSALPFLCYSFAAQSISAGLASIFNATTPLWGALVAWIWFRERLDGPRLLGLALGFAGVLGLAWDKASFKAGAQDTGLAVLACLAATLMYGVAANATRRWLTGVPALALATGSQGVATLALALPAALAWPAQPAGLTAWSAALALGVLSTGVAYVLYFRLIARVGPARATTVTYLIPLFAVLWGFLALQEALTLSMLLGGAVILLGTSLATGWWRPFGTAAKPSA